MEKMDVVSLVMGRNHGKPERLDPSDQEIIGDFRKAVWMKGLFGLFTGICLGVLVAPYARRFVGPHSNVATPLGLGALFSTIGSGIAANRESHTLTYAMFKRQETLKAVHAAEAAKHRDRVEKERTTGRLQKKKSDDDDWTL